MTPEISDSERRTILQKRLKALRMQLITTKDGRALGNIVNSIKATKQTLEGISGRC